MTDLVRCVKLPLGVLVALVGAGQLMVVNLQRADANSPYWTRSTVATDGLTSLQGIAFVGGGKGWMIADRNQLLTTEDGGSSWRISSTQFPGPDAVISKLSFQADRSGWAAGSRNRSPAIWRTTDGGNTWAIGHEWLPKTEGESGALLDVHFVDQSRGWAVGFHRAASLIVATVDGGAHWQTQYAGNEISGQFSAIRFADAERGFALSPNGVLESDEGGRTWRLAHFDPTGILNDLVVNGPHDAWVAGGWGTLVHRSKRGWSLVHVPAANGKFLGWITFVNPRLGWVSGPAGDILTTRNGGDTWTVDGASSNFPNGDVICASGSRVFRIVKPASVYFHDVSP